MSGSFLSRAAIICLSLVPACSAGDLTLPGASEPAAAIPASLRIASGDNQRADPGALLGESLRVQVLDQDGQPLAGVVVQFSFQDELPNARVEPSSDLTDQDGHATTLAQLGSVPGEQLISARVAGTGSPNLSVVFRALAKEEDGGDDGSGDDDGSGNGDDDGSGGGGSDGDDDGGSGGDDDGSGDDDDVDTGAAPDPLGVPAGHYPPPGSCRVWLPGVSLGQQSSPTSCVSAEQAAPAGSWIIARPEGVSGLIHVLVVHPDRAGVIVRLWVYDAASGRLLWEEDV